jgi:hypothetical protein
MKNGNYWKIMKTQNIIKRTGFTPGKYHQSNKPIQQKQRFKYTKDSITYT